MERGLVRAGLLLLLGALATPAGAVGNLVDVTVYDRKERRVLPVHRHRGRLYVVGSPGNEYQIRVRNRTGGDILSIVSVDGVNAVSGETAAWHQTGYVLGPQQGFDIKGWRKSLERVAAFFFTEHQNSYAARTGRPDNLGVIGVAVFRRKAEPPARIDQSTPWPESAAPGEREDSAFPEPAGAAADDPQNLLDPARLGEAHRQPFEIGSGRDLDLLIFAESWRGQCGRLRHPTTMSVRFGAGRAAPEAPR